MEYSCSHHKLAQGYTVFGSERLPVDDRGNLYWHLGNWGADMERYHQIGILNNVFSRWQRYFIPWEFRSTPNFEDAQWVIYWVRNNKVHLPNGDVWDTKDAGLFDFVKNKSTLAVQFASPDLLCLINDDHNYALDAKGPNFFQLEKVLLHEMGHGFRLGHTQASVIKALKAKGKLPIMGAYYHEDAQITEDEEKAVRDLHGEHLNEFSDHPTVLRIMQTFASPDPPEPLTIKISKIERFFKKIFGRG